MALPAYVVFEVHLDEPTLDEAQLQCYESWILPTSLSLLLGIIVGIIVAFLARPKRTVKLALFSACQLAISLFSPVMLSTGTLFFVVLPVHAKRFDYKAAAILVPVAMALVVKAFVLPLFCYLSGVAITWASSPQSAHRPTGSSIPRRSSRKARKARKPMGPNTC